MITCSTKEIVMGKQSSLDSVDPHVGRLSAYGVISEIEKIINDIEKKSIKRNNLESHPFNLNLILINTCYDSIEWSNEIL